MKLRLGILYYPVWIAENRKNETRLAVHHFSLNITLILILLGNQYNG